MKCKLTCLSALSLVLLNLSTNASTVFVDFGDGGDASTPTGTDTYNTTANQPNSNAALNPLGKNTNGAGVSNGSISATALLDTSGMTTGVGVELSAYTNGTGQLRSNNALGGGFSHNPVAGIEAFATGDAYWVNNHNGNGTGVGNEFGLVLTFTGLTEALYDLDVFSVSSSTFSSPEAGSWSVTVGVGDADIETFNTNDQDNISGWTDVAPVGGVITLTHVSGTPNGTFENVGIQFASITAVPEPSSTALLGLGFLALLARRR